MNGKECTSCSLGKSIYRQFPNECQHCGFVKKYIERNKDGEGSIRKTRKKKKILSTLDILISVFVVTPLVVACWRGTWQLMDIYANYFPPWESFFIGTLIQILIGISQESFDVLVNKKHKSLISGVLAFIFMKLYTIVLNVVTNMHWRGGWIIVDEYFGVEFHSETSKTTVKNGREAAGFYLISFLVMFAMKCLRNLNSPPFEICLDYGDEMFLFPNMFKVKFTFSVAVSTKIKIENSLFVESINQPTTSKQTISLDPKTFIWRKHSKPFSSKYKYVPKGFLSTTSTENSLANKIQNDKILADNSKLEPNFITEQVNNKNYFQNITHGFKMADPFQEFKPLHPGEINLLSPKGMRFAPTTWKIYSSKYFQGYKAQKFSAKVKKDPMEISTLSMLIEKPFSLMLNVYPMRQKYGQYQYLLEMSPFESGNRQNKKYSMFLEHVASKDKAEVYK